MKDGIDYSTLVGSKERKKRGTQMVEHASAPVSDFAKKQMKVMGWTDGTGLGKHRNGRTSHIVVKQREEQSGVGVKKNQEYDASQWWMDNLGDTFGKLNQHETKRHFSDQELFQATGGVRFGMRAGKTRNLDKWKRSESDMSSSAATTKTETKEERRERKRRRKEEKQKKREQKKGRKRRKQDD